MAEIDWSKGDITAPAGAEPDWNSGTITPPAKPSGVIRRLADTGISLAKGVVGVPEAAVGIGDLVSGGRIGKLAEAAGFRPKEAKDILSSYYSPEQQAANQQVQDAQGFLPTVGAMVSNPSTILNQAVESAPSMLVGGAVSRGALALAPRMGAIAAGAIGEGATAAGQNAEQVRQEDPNGTLTPGQSAILAASGALTGGLGFAAGKVANKLGIGDVQTMLASGKLGAQGAEAAATGAKKGIIRKAAEGFATEGALQELPQSYQEQVAQNIAQGKPWDEGAAAAGAQGLLAGGLMGGIGGPLEGGHQAAPVTPVATAPEAEPTGPTPALGFSPLAGTPIIHPDGTVTLNGEQEFQQRTNPVKPSEAMGLDANAGPLSRAAVIAVDSAPALTYDNSPTGRMVADEQGGVRPEGRAEVVNRQQAQDEQQQADETARQQRIDLGQSPYTPVTPIESTQPAPVASPAQDLLQIPLDTTPTGKMYADASGNVKRETRADTISRDQPTETIIPNRIRAGKMAREAGPGYEVAQVTGGFVVRQIPEARIMRERADTAAADQARINADARTASFDKASTDLETTKQRDLDQIQSQSREVLGRLPEQQVAAAQAATDETPTAFQLAMQRAKAKRTTQAKETPADVPQPAKAPEKTSPAPRAQGTPQEQGVARGPITRQTQAVPATPAQADQVAARVPAGQQDQPAGNGATVAPAGTQQRDGALNAGPPATKPASGSAAPAPVVSAPATHLGRNNTPLTDGGKPFKDRAQADEARKLQPMMRVVKVARGFALTEKTPAQLAAQDKAARRLAIPNTSPAGQPIPAHAFIASEGGLHLKNRSDLGVQGNPRIGNRTLYAGLGKGLTIEQAAEKLTQSGYLREGASHSDAMALIKRSLTTPQYTAEGTERLAEADKQAQFEARQAEDEATADTQELDDHEHEYVADLDPNDDNVPFDVSGSTSNTSLESGMRSMGFTEEEIHEAIANESRKPQADSQGNRVPGEAAGRDAQESADQRGQAPGPDQDGRGEDAGLTAPTRANILAQQERTDAADKTAKAQRKADDERARKDQERKDIAARSQAAADTFELGGDAEQNLSGQSGLFSRNTGKTSPSFDVQKAVDTLTANWANKPKIVVAQNLQDPAIPERVRSHDEQQRSQGAQGSPEGFYYGGKVYLMADQLANEKDVARVLFHEALGHFGLRGVFGDSLKPILQGISMVRRAEVAAKAKAYGLDMYNPKERMQAAEEVLAELAQTHPEIGFVKRAIAAVRTWLRANVPGFSNLRVSDDEILRNYILPARGFVERGETMGKAGAVPVFSRSTKDNQGARSADDTTPGIRAARQILEAIRQDGDSADYALRVIPGEFKGAIKIGDTLPASKQWEDGNETDAKLDGTSAVRIKGLDEKSILEALKNLGALGKNGPNGFYFGDRIALVKGESIGSGEDVGESIIKDAEVVGVWEKPVQGLSEIQPNGSTTPDSGDVKFSRSKMAGETQRQHTPEQLKSFQNVGRTVEEPTLKERAQALWKDAGKKLAQGIVDQFAPIKDLDKTAYGLMRLAKGAAGAFETLIKGGQLKLEGGVYNFDDAKKGGVLDRLLKPLHGEHHDFFWWVAANRADRLAGEGRENLFSAQDIANLKTLADGKTDYDYTIQNGIRKGQVTRNRAEVYRDSLVTFNAFNKNVLDMAEQSGLIDADSRKLWEHEFYVPFYRVADDDGVRGMNIKGSVVRQEAFKHLKGGKDKLNSDLLDNTLMNWAHLLDAGAKNRAAKASIEAAERMGLATPGPQSTLGQMAADIHNKKGVVWFMDDGHKRYSMISDQDEGPMILTAISSLEYAGMNNPVMKAMGAMKHALTLSVTASPFFKVRNLIRDSVQAIGTSDLSYNAAGNLVQGWKLTDPKSDAYFRLLAGGGTIHFGTMLEGSQGKRIQSLVESGVDAATILKDPNAVKAFYKKWVQPTVHAYNELGDRGEAINRAALYDQLVKGGMSHAEASLQARDLMDFSMQGSFATVRFLTQVVPFMNARIQGLYKLGKSAKEDPAKFAAVLGAVTAMSLGLLAAYSDDDDWKKREEWDRNNFWWFKAGGTAFRIPKPFEVGAIATLAERGFELAFDKEMTNKRFMDQVVTLLGDNLSMNPIPQLVKPMLDVYANKDSFSGRPIESMGMEKLKSEYRFNGNTSMTARAASTAMNAVTGLVGQEGLSPVQIDSMLRGYFSWLGSFVIGAGDMLARPATDQPEKATADYWKMGTGGMVSDLRDAPSRYVSQMYTQAKELEQAYGTWRSLQKEGKTEEARDFQQANRDELGRYRQVENVKKGESELNALQRMVERSNMDPDAKRERIRQIQMQKDQRARLVAPH